MAATTAVSSRGLKIEYSTTLNGSYTKLAGLTDCQVPEKGLRLDEVTTYDSDEYAEEVIGTGMYGYDEFTCELNLSGAQAITLDSMADAITVYYWKITTLTNTYSFRGLISKIGATAPLKGAIKQTIGIRPTGKVTVA